MMNEKEKREYLPKQEIAYWYPISFNVKDKLEKISNQLRDEQGLFIPPFQLIERCVVEYENYLTKDRYGKI